MGARKNKIHHDPNSIERIRGSIQASLIIKMLNEKVLSGDKLDPARVSAALGLLKKVLPDQAAITHSGDAENPIVHDVQIRPQLSRAEWEKRHVLKK